MRTVAFCYGWSEGPWQSRLFAKNLSRNGFSLSKDPANADIIIAHSSGCYLVPKKFQAEVVFLIDPPYWPGRSSISSIVANIAVGAREHHKEGEIRWWLNKLAHNGWYAITRPQGTYHASTRIKLKHLPKAPPAQSIVLVRNIRDTFCDPKIMNLVGKERGYKFTQLPGAHEHCWIHPELYIDLLLKEL